MASRNRKPRNRGSYHQRSDNFGNRKNPGNQRSSSSKNRSSRYYCDICGTSVPHYGSDNPLCPRCMIPMLQVKSSGSKNSKRGEYDLSSRIYYQTDGHPQYVNLPKDHPDPDDADAVAEYRNRRERAKQARRGPSQDNRPPRGRRNQPHSKRSRQGPDRNRQENRHDPKTQDAGAQRNETENNRPPVRAQSPHDTAAPPAEPKNSPENRPQQDTSEAPREKSTRRRKRTPVKSPATAPDVKENRDDDRPVTARKRRESSSGKRTPDVAAAEPVRMVREEDYTGTALTSDRSAATIISDTLREAAGISEGNLHSDYQSGSPVTKTEPEE